MKDFVKLVNDYLSVFVKVNFVKVHMGDIVVDFLDMVGNIIIREYSHVGKTKAIVKFNIGIVDFTTVVVVFEKIRC